MVLKYTIPLFALCGIYAFWVIPTVQDFAQIFLNSNIPVKQSWTGISPVDMGFSFLVKFFVAAVQESDTYSRLATIVLLSNSYALFTVLCVVAGKANNRGKLSMSPLLWGMMGQSCGFCIALPIYMYLHLHKSANAGPSSVPAPVAGALTPSLILGFIVPTVLMLTPPGPNTFSDNTYHILVAGWQFFPVWITLSQTLFEKLGCGCGKLGFTYFQAMLVAAAGHCYMFSYPLENLWTLYQPLFAQAENMSDVVIHIFKADYWITFGAGVIWVLSLSAGRGLVSKLVTAVVMALGCVLVGPGAVIAGAFWWNEKCVDTPRQGKVQEASKCE
ncbi:hypothetical protein L873DRAFT_1845748 [Choiromyces venosus 120613-1]|uniref:Uncharacterized protein n=1 Tax=Choiromyces venosus 120613-1 TaxID=1336337 RepID=A0A3N4JCC1_9PEZI|nr:hypothetical protein L873DRAFT_1845748 [Choiromyces venosus 120613-1]